MLLLTITPLETLSPQPAVALPHIVAYVTSASKLPTQSADVRITITFYEDGIIKSYSEDYGVLPDSKRTIVRAFDVQRADNVLIQITKNETGESAKTSYVMLPDAIHISRASIRSIDQFVLVPRLGGDHDTTTWEHVLNGVTYLKFTFGPKQVRIEQPTRNQTYIYHKLKPEGVTVLTSVGRENNSFETSVERDGVTTIRYGTSRGLVLNVFRVVGQAVATDPLTAVLNFELLDEDPIGAIALFPFVGGSPPR